MRIIREFKEFAVKGNVIDMAVGIMIGAAFGKIVTSLVNDIVMPPIGLLLGKADFPVWSSRCKPKPPPGPGDDPIRPFINTLLDFLIVAFVIFLAIKQINRLKKHEVVAPTTKECPYCCTPVPIKATRCGHCTSDLAVS